MDTTGLTEKKMKKGKNGKRGSRYYDAHGALVARTCSTCDKVLPKESFPRAKNTSDGIGSNCTDCTKAAQDKYRSSSPNRYALRSPEEVASVIASTYPSGEKKCSSCSTTKDLQEFYHNSSYRTGVSDQCRTCIIQESKERQQKYAQEDPNYYKKVYLRTKYKG